jgi:hypothetical protein
MKILFSLATLFFLLSFSANAQFSVGFKGGTSPSLTPNTFYTIANRTSPRNEFSFNITNVNSAVYLGGFAQMDIDQHFFLRGEALYNSYENNYLVRYTFESRFRSSQENSYTEKVQRLDFPVSIGARIGAVEINSGIVTRLLIQNENEMKEINGYGESTKTVQMGVQTGVGLNLMNVNIGLTYQLDFQNYGAHIIFDNENLDLQSSPARIIASLGYKF